MKSLNLKLIIPLVVVIMLSVVGFAGYKIFNRKAEPQAPEVSNKKLEPVNQIPIKERPFIQIFPRSDGREITIVVENLSSANQAEYELEYEAGSLLQGAFGTIDFTKESSPAKRNLLLGSCSAGGKCSYHEDVNGGSLVLRYTNGDITKLKGEWNFQTMQEQAGSFTSRDAKFTFNVGKSGLPANTFVIIAQTFGLPQEVDGEILAGPYNVSLPQNQSLRTSSVELTMRLSEETTEASLLGWDGSSWQEYEAQIDGQILQASVDQPTTYLAVISAADSE